MANTPQAKLRKALGWFVNDNRFTIFIGGNPKAVKAMWAEARAIFEETDPMPNETTANLKGNVCVVHDPDSDKPWVLMLKTKSSPYEASSSWKEWTRFNSESEAQKAADELRLG
jgi:hypothetical protein